jgi:hypothetical protein
MNKASLAAAAALAAALSAPAHAAYVLDTGTPLTGATNETFNTANYYAEEFYIGAGQTITSLSAYLLPGTGSGTAFTFDIYQNNSNFTSQTVTRNAGNGTLLYSVGASYTAGTGGGWNTVAADWSPTTSGYYWLAIQTTTTGVSLFAPSAAGASGTALPTADASAAGTTGRFTATSTMVGLEANAVPLPAAVWLLGSGIVGLGAMARRRRSAG